MNLLRLRLGATLAIVQGRRLGTKDFIPLHNTALQPGCSTFLGVQYTHLVRRGLARSTARMASATSTGGDGAGSSTGNRLAGETSPYLLQHANNPVHWMPWGEAAFRKAREEDKPIFLSIGYSTCHWCHVMERESFESNAVAAILNEHFVSIKVDREERPDVDQCFMTFVQATSGGGGWPMSVWLTPTLKPFVGATYFPERRFIDVLKTLAEKWSTDREEVVQQGDKIIRILQAQLTERAAEGGDAVAFLGLPESREAVKEGVRVLDKGHDDVSGGWSGMRGMKFPQPSRMNLLLRARYLLGSDSVLGVRALRMAETTLAAMARGGIYDHVFDGFARYSTDPRWHVPHFEKMLYDQSQLVTAYVEAYQVTGKDQYADVAKGVLRYVLRDLTDPAGGFYSAEDADSFPFEGATAKKEGAFCVWTESDLRRILDVESTSLPAGTGQEIPVSRVFCRVFGVRPEGNVNPAVDIHGELENQNVLFRAESAQQAATVLELTCSQEDIEAALAGCRNRLVAERSRRPAPHLDDKVLTSWNGLMISALARASQALPKREDKAAYLGAAEKAAGFVRNHLYRPHDGGLMRSWRKGKTSPVQGFADDYAFLIRGLLDLYEANPRGPSDWCWLRWARQLQTEMDEGFACLADAGGGYYSARASEGLEEGSENKAEALPLRLKTDYDGAEPGAGSVAADNLLRLSGYCGGADGAELKRKAAEQLAAAFARKEAPQALPELTASLVIGILGPKQVIIAGDPEDEDTQALVRAAQQSFCPNLILMLDDRGEPASGATTDTNAEDGAPLYREALDAIRDTLGGGDKRVVQTAAAYVCFNNSCSTPVHTAQDLVDLLDHA